MDTIDINKLKEDNKGKLSSAKEEGASRNEIRGIRKENRAALRDARVENIADTELANIGKAPITGNVKKQIDESIARIAPKNLLSDLKTVQDTYTPPVIEPISAPNEQAVKESIRRQRRASWADALTAFGRGLQGKSTDPSTFLSSQIQQERKQQYDQYKDASTRAREAERTWGTQYRKDLMDWIDKKLADQKTSEVEKMEYEKWKRKMELDERKFEAEKAGGKYSKATDPANKFPNTNKFYQLTGNSEFIINELAKNAGKATNADGSLKYALKPEEVERLTNTLLSQIYDAKGNPIPGKENLLNELTSTAQDIANLTKQRNKAFHLYNSAVIKKADDPNLIKMNELDQQIEELQGDFQNILGGQQTQSTTDFQQKLDDFFN